MTLQILFAGSGAFGVPTLERLIERHVVAHVYTQPDRPAGRGKAMTPTPVAELAAARGLALTRTANLNAEPLPPAEVLVVIAFGQKISPGVTGHPRLGAVNLHASRLPKYRGAAPIHWALMNGERVVGNSVIRLAEQMDAGAILGMSEVNVLDAETTGELHDRLALDGTGLMLRVLDELASGTAVEREQDHTAATLAPKLSRASSAIDFNEPAARVAARINGLSPWPGCQVRLMDGDAERDVLTLLRAIPAVHTRAEPGTITTDGRLACGEGTALEVLDLQPRGKRPMSLAAYRNGKPWEPGFRLVSHG